MKASEAMQQLVWLMSLYGDLDLYLDDQPYDELIDNVEFRQGEEREDWPDCKPRETKNFPPRFVVTINY